MRPQVRNYVAKSNTSGFYPWIHNENKHVRSPFLWLLGKKSHGQQNHIYTVYMYMKMYMQKKRYIYIYDIYIYLHQWLISVILSNTYRDFSSPVIFIGIPPSMGISSHSADLFWLVPLFGIEILHILLVIHGGCLGLMGSRFENYRKVSWP